MNNNPTTNCNYEWIPKERKHPKATPFLRKDVVGGWKDRFTPELSGQLCTLYPQAEGCRVRI